MNRKIHFRAQIVHLDQSRSVKYYVIRLQDISSLKGVPFDALCLSNPNLTDLSPLTGMDLKFLQIAKTRVNDISPLQDMPLEILDMRETDVTDVNALTNVPLRIIGLDIDKITNGITMLRNKESITLINKKPPKRFWSDYDWEREPE